MAASSISRVALETQSGRDFQHFWQARDVIAATLGHIRLTAALAPKRPAYSRIRSPAFTWLGEVFSDTRGKRHLIAIDRRQQDHPASQFVLALIQGIAQGLGIRPLHIRSQNLHTLHLDRTGGEIVPVPQPVFA